MGGDLVVASALNQGISQIIDELLSFNQGSEFYRYNIKYLKNAKMIGFIQAEQKKP